MRKKLDLTNQIFGRLTVISDSGERQSNCTLWNCVCECGRKVRVSGVSLRRGLTKSCGCLHKEIATRVNTKHGHSCGDLRVSPTYNSWQTMMRRCTNPNSDNWHRYGGRGIKVAERWKDFNNFLADMGERPSLKHKLDRINNDGDYEPGNCCWKTQKEQMRNTSVNKIITAWGRSQTLTEWAEETGIKIATISKRLKCGWDSERALSVPVRAKQLED